MKKQLLMMIATFLLAASTQARIIEPANNQVWWGYFNESDFEVNEANIGTGQAMTLMAGIHIPPVHEQLGHATIDAVRVYLPSYTSTLSNLKIWISKELPNKFSDADFYQSTSGTLNAGANDFKLSTPYEIDNEGFYIGYCVTSSTGYFIRCGGKDTPNAFWIGNPEANMAWEDLNGYGFGKLAFQILVKNGNFSTNCATAEDFGQNMVIQGQEASIPITITNLGENAVKSISYTISTEGGSTTEEKEVSLGSLAMNVSKTINIPFASDEETKKYQKTFTITKVNGEANTAKKNRATGFLITLKESQPVTPVIEEFFGTWCGWCPRGMVGMEKIREIYGDRVIQIAVHNSDPMEISAYNTIINKYCDGYPGSITDRQIKADPSFSGLQDALNSAFDRVAPASITLSAEWDNNAKTKVVFNTTTRFVYSDDNGQYGIAFVLVEDGLRGTGSSWAQSNYYSGQGSGGEMEFWYKAGSSVSDIEYNNVAVAGWNIQDGVNNSVNPVIDANTPQEYSFIGDISDNLVIQDKSKLKAIVLLINRTNGTIINAAQSSISEFKTIIEFADINVKKICVDNWDSNNDGELSYAEAAAVTDLGTVFKNNKKITSFNELQYFTGLASIGDSAFSACSGLTSITIPNSVTIIGSLAFSSCSGLISITIPSSVKSIGNEAFFGCGLTSITIPESVTSIGEWAFIYCKGLTSVTIPNSVENIGNEAFFCCGLTSITIPESVTSIGYGAFASCHLLTTIKVEAGNQIYDSRNNCNAIIETATNTLIACCNNTGLIPESVTDIGMCAFYGCDAITSIIIPEGVTSIGGSAFRCCNNLTTIIIPESVTSIGNSVFQYCYNLTSVNIPKSITRIEYYTFSGCRALTSITIPNNVTSIEDKAFENCSGMKELYCLAENVPETDSDAFDNTPIASATLHVPAGSVDLYKAASPWNEFGTIVALTTDMADIEINETIFPDANFRSWINQKFGADGVLTGAEIASATYINVSNRGIQNLKGIECFTELTELDCSFNLLTTLDVTKNTNLKTLNLSHNNLSGDITGISGYMITSGQSSPITSLNISDNKLSGNIGLFANRFINLKSLNASGNCLEDVYPMIPATVTALDISRQTISRVVPLHLAKLSISDIGTKVPSILLYDHVNRTFTPNINLMCNTADNSWGMMMSYQNGQLAVPYVSEQNTYYGESGDTLNVAVYNNDGTPEGSTFRISLSFDEGDGNFDGQVNVLDLQTDILYIMEKYLTRPYNFTAANMWDDNLINVQDIIRLVDLLMNMEQTESASNARRKAPSLETNPEASIYIQDGQLMLNTIEPVAALDLLISNASSINVADNLERMGMSVVTKKSSDGLHIIAYSMSGNCIPSGISAIGTVDTDVATVRSVMLSDSEANAISVSIDNDATDIHSIKNGKLIIDNEDAVYDLSGRQIVNGRLKRGVYIKNGHKIAK